MVKKVFVLTLVTAFLLAGGALAADLAKTAPEIKHRFIMGDEVLPDVAYYPLSPGFTTDSPGIQLGTTYYDYQTNGSSGNRAVVCNDNSKYFCWMKLLGWPYPPAPRHVYHNWIDASGVLNPNGFSGQVSQNTGSGYTTMDVIYGNRGAIAYHCATGTTPTYVTLSVDLDPPGLGFFDHYNPADELFPQTPNSPGRLYWPYIAVDRNDRIHIVATENSDVLGWFQRVGYTRSTDGGQTWSTAQLVDTAMVISSVIDASPVSDKVVLAYSRTQDTSTQWYNDIYYVLSQNGLVWDFRYGQVNVTNYLTDTDSLWAYTDLDIIFDYNDYFHIVWTDQWVTDEGIYFKTFLKHYSSETEEITEIMHHPDSLWLPSIEGAWNRPISKMNLGVRENPHALFCTFTYFDTSDMSAGGFANGEIYVVYSYDGGVTWNGPENMTNSPSPGCFPGQCDSDHWSTLADVVNDSLHVIYINDKDAGGIPQTEGSATENPVMYLAYPTPGPSAIGDEISRPVNFSLNQNYPNPFNASTVISYNLKEAAQVTIDVFNVTGAKVATLVNEHKSAGSYNVVWNGSEVASGVYYYKMTAGDQTETREMVLLK